MSFAGHVFDMIRRNKEDREKLRELRERSANDRTKYTSRIPDISEKEYKVILQQTKEREKQEQKYFFRMRLLILGILLIIVVLAAVLKRCAG